MEAVLIVGERARLDLLDVGGDGAPDGRPDLAGTRLIDNVLLLEGDADLLASD